MDTNTEKTVEQKPTETPKPATSPAAEAPKTATAPAGKPAAAKTTAAPAKKAATVKKVEVPKKRESKIAPIQAKLIPLIEKGPMTVQALAAKLDCTERQVRQAIDRARGDSTLDRKKANIVRVARNTFGYSKPKSAA